MTTTKDRRNTAINAEISLAGGEDWILSHMADIKSHIKKESKKRSPELRLTTKLNAIRYAMEEYLEDNEAMPGQVCPIDRFVKAYLKALKISFKQFAINIDTTDGNLKKYLSGDRKFTTDLAMKFGHFFHTAPDLWLQIYTKNELLLLKKEEADEGKYKKYDYRNLVQLKRA